MPFLTSFLFIGCNESQPLKDTPPTFNSISIQPNVAFSTSEISCVANVEDIDNDSLSLTFVWNNEDGIELGVGRTLQLSPEQTSPFDVIVCTAEVSDGTHLITDSASIELQNQLPVIDDIAISPAVVTVESNVTCEINASDPDLDALTKSMQWFANDVQIGEAMPDES